MESLMAGNKLFAAIGLNASTGELVWQRQVHATACVVPSPLDTQAPLDDV